MKDVPSRVGLILTRKFEEKVLGEPGKGSVRRRAKGRSEKKEGEKERRSVERVWSEKKKEKRRDERLRKFDI